MPRQKASPKTSNTFPTVSRPSGAPPTVSARWLFTAAGIAVVAAAVCAWGTLCFLFWQGSWQLLYHPKSAVTRTPASVGLQYEAIGFAATAAGTPQLQGWWIPAGQQSRYTAVYLEDKDGNIGDTVDALTALHGAGVNVFAFDYRGYGLSTFQRPSEARWREDAESAIGYLTNTRHVPAGSLVLVGKGLGANLALEVAAAHPELAGVVMDEPLAAPTDAIFGDPRAKLVPAHLFVRDSWNPNPPATALRIPSLWFYRTPGHDQPPDTMRDAYQQVSASKQQVWLSESPDKEKNYDSAFRRWLDDLPGRAATP